MPVLSIVIPIYNMSPWLAVALESCLQQTHKELEILVVDDGSPDNSREIAEFYALQDGRVKVLCQANAGVGAARQLGQDKATGDFITWLDADDVLAPQAAALWLGAAAQHGADMVCGNAVAFSSRTFNVRRYFPHAGAAGLRFDSAPAYWKSKVLWRWAFSLPFVRRHALRHKHYKLGQDMLFMLEALRKAASFAQVQGDVYYFRQEHKSAHASLHTQVEHGFAHFAEARRIVLGPPYGQAGIKPLVKYLNENYWRDIKKIAPRLHNDAAHWEERIIELGFELFDGLDGANFRAAALAPEVKEQGDFLPFVDAMIAKDCASVAAQLAALRAKAGQSVAPDSARAGAATPLAGGNTVRELRHRLKATLNPRAWRTRFLLRKLEALAAARKGLPRASLDSSQLGGR